MIKVAKHSASSRKSMRGLADRVIYIEDPVHKNHQNKLVLESKNHRCGGCTAKDFMISIIGGFHRYNKCREGKRGKRTKKLWEEFCYSSEEGSVPRPDGSGMEACLNVEEREKAEQRILKGPIGRGSVRLNWHIDLITGRCDCHFLVGIHDEKGVIWINDVFGHGKKSLKLELERIEEELLQELNRRRSNDLQLQTPRQRHIQARKKAGKMTFAMKLVAVRWDGTSETLSNAAQQAGYFVHNQTAKAITVHSLEFKKKPKEIRYNLPNLTKEWAKEKVLIDRKKQPQKDDPKVTDPTM